MQPPKPTDTNEDTPFNMAMIFYISLNKFMDMRDKASIMGDIRAWCRCSQIVYFRVRFKFSKEEKEYFDTKFKEVKNLLSSNVGNASVSQQINSMVTENVTGLLGEIDSEIMVKMNRYRMIFPNVTAGSLKDITKRFGL